MDRFVPTDLRPLFPRERAALLDVLRTLDSSEWQFPTVCAEWSIHDIALHLLNGDLRFIAGRRDSYQSPHGPVVQPPYGRSEVTALVDEINNRWIAGARWMSPRQVIDQLEQSGRAYADTLAGLDMTAPGIPVDWIAPGPAPTWMDVAREYTERWIHQQQIRDAAGRPPLLDRWAAYPVFDTFMLALPNALRAVEAPLGANVHLTVRGDAGCTWIVRKEDAGWTFGSDRGATPFASIVLDQDDAWRLYTKGTTKDTVLPRIARTGNPAAIDAMIDMVTVLA
ncbi:MAG: maleylpyruvate isomerase family mycothiol-dependent enzyme [Thermomicrobiales bacterium]|nr:maleylpyruvate isomerase family mycothiol-dependent enzyme [Thermomicrobiales bacterium]MCO5220485.1 maleylpyruvate isomerase family mycothiol-dependent enzyme [Thermomicrobiales bacterium]